MGQLQGVMSLVPPLVLLLALQSLPNDLTEDYGNQSQSKDRFVR